MSPLVQKFAQGALLAFAGAIAGMCAAWLLVMFIAITVGETPHPGIVAFAMALGALGMGIPVIVISVEEEPRP